MTTDLSTVADHVLPVMEAVIPVDSFSRILRCKTKQEKVQERFEEHSNEFEVLT